MNRRSNRVCGIDRAAKALDFALARVRKFDLKKQLATGGSVGKLKAAFDENLAAVYKAGIQNSNRLFLEL